MDREELNTLITALTNCESAEDGACPEDCPMKDDEWKREGRAACRALVDDEIIVPAALIRRTVALLKAQEPRVMTLEDICESIEHDKRISVYLQQKDGICREPRPALYTNLYGEGIDLRLGVDYVDYGGWLEQIVLYTKEYLKTWCLWTSRPTDEQREAVKWE